jgi:hypothetical protein
MEQIRNVYKILMKPLKERDHLEDAGINKPVTVSEWTEA